MTMFWDTDSTTPQLDLQSENWFRLIIEAAPSAKFVVGRSGRIMLVNRKAETLFGHGRDELLSMSIDALVPMRFRDGHQQHLENFFATPEARAMGAGRELFGRRKDGVEVPIEIGLSPIETPQGIFIIAAIIDITERKRAEALFKLVVNAVPNAMLLVNASGRIMFVNRNAEALFGYARGELIGQPLEMLVPERVRAGHPERVREFFAAPNARPMGVGRDLHACRKDGTEVLVEIGLNPIETPEGLCTLASIIDITERQRQQDELRRSNAELEQFAYIASHDLQEPLRMVASYTELLGQRYQGKLDAKADKYIFYAVDGARRMQRLVADLLLYSRVGSQGKELVPVSAREVVGHVLTMLRDAIRSSGTTVECGDLPMVMADEGQLTQLFQNLIGNAIKFRAERPPVVHVEASFQDKRWLFLVRDNGIGLDMNYADRIFQMFQRLHERGKYEGSGIGLSIAKRIVERHGGQIWVESALGAGTTFFFTLQGASEAGVV